MNITLTRFAKGRLFPKDGRRNAITGTDAQSFEDYINAHEPEKILDGYAAFCKLYVYKNWTSSRVAAVPITAQNEHLLHSAYEARNKKELAVLNRWFEGVEPPLANYLLVILYDREQLHKEGDKIKTPWGVVGCLATSEAEEIPLAPITMLRNALGVEEGGSGVPLDREAYKKSVEFWSRHANWRVPRKTQSD
ncbi:MAG: DUF3228 family protein [Oceanococcus sp.]